MYLIYRTFNTKFVQLKLNKSVNVRYSVFTEFTIKLHVRPRKNGISPRFIIKIIALQALEILANN